MYLSTESLIALSQIIPILLLASYFDKDVLIKISTYTTKTKYYWLFVVVVILIGEFIAIMGFIDGSIDGWRAYVVLVAVLLALINLFSIASWRVLGFDLISGLPEKKKKRKK
jgi:hypothetical protein